MGKKKTSEKIRLWFQFIWTVITNSFVTGFVEGKIYTGKFKNMCFPGLNCYSCPGALGSCPIGSLQSFFGARDKKFPFFISGFLIFAGAVFGRFVCGWLCPFGFVQDLLYKIPFPKKIRTFRYDKLLRKLKYVILIIFVILLPLFVVDITGLGLPWFCKYICPAGTLQGGIPLSVLNSGIRNAIGFLYAYKVVILAVTVFCSIIIYRPFCKYICPLGAIYSAFNKISVFKIRCDKNHCINCSKCSKVCKMNVNPSEKPDDPECIRCGLCLKECPTGALISNFCKNNNTEKSKEKIKQNEN